MFIVYVIILSVILLVTVIKEKNVYNPTFILAAVWLLIGVLCFVNVYEMNTVTNRAYLMVSAGIVCFSLGCVMRNKARLTFGFLNRLTKDGYNIINYPLLLFLFTVVLLFTIPLFIKSVLLLHNGVSMEVIRFNYRNLESGLLINSALSYDIECYIVAPSEFVAAVLLPIVLMDKNSFRKRILVIELILFLILHMYVTGARSFLIDVVIVMAIYFIMNRDMMSLFSNFVKKTPKFFFVIIVIGAVAMVILMTALRKGDKSIVKEIYCYFSISLPLLDVHLKIMDSQPDFTYGMTLLQGVLRPFALILKVLGFNTPIYNHARDLVAANDTFYVVGRGSANSFVTSFYYFYMDFGIVGVLLGNLLYGYLSQDAYRLLIKKTDRRRQAVYLLVAVGVFLTFSRLQFTAYKYVYAFVILFVSFKKQRRKSTTFDSVLKKNTWTRSVI